MPKHRNPGGPEGADRQALRELRQEVGRLADELAELRQFFAAVMLASAEATPDLCAIWDALLHWASQELMMEELLDRLAELRPPTASPPSSPMPQHDAVHGKPRERQKSLFPTDEN